MSEITAINKFTCPACGAEAVWSPAKKALVCPYCGTDSPAELKSDGILIEEMDLLSALRDLPKDKRGWAVATKTVRCRSCNAVSVFNEKRIAQNCDFCGSPSIVSAEDTDAPIRPSSVLAFRVPDTRVREEIRKWYGSHWFAPNKLKSKALTDTLHGIYLPYWTFDAHSHCPWEAEAGHHYQVRDDKGNTRTETRWSHASGLVENFFDDLLVPASLGVHPKLLADLEPFPTTTDLVPYDPGYVSGWVVEQYQLDLIKAEEQSRERMIAELRGLCIAQIPGDTHRGLRIQPTFSSQTFKHVLLPVWLVTYTYGTKNYQVAVNGHTGKITGEYPISWVKVTFVVILALLALAVFFSLQE
jgi:Zn finger protein HypA/HybF involved in hydrogenase expression